jgi:hypothetical protein
VSSGRCAHGNLGMRMGRLQALPTCVAVVWPCQPEWLCLNTPLAEAQTDVLAKKLGVKIYEMSRVTRKELGWDGEVRSEGCKAMYEGRS